MNLCDLTEFGGWRYGGGFTRVTLQFTAHSWSPQIYFPIFFCKLPKRLQNILSLSHRSFLFLFSEALTPSDTQALWEWVAWEGSGILSILVTISKYLSILFFSKRNFSDSVKSVKYSSLDKKKFLKLSSCYLSSLISNLSRRLKFNFK